MITTEDTSSARLQATPAGVQQFRNLRFGLSVHWGLYALPGRGEWVMHSEQIPIPEYEKLAGQFNPIRFNAQAWAALIAESGARALLITTKHHDGFCMYDTALTNYKITNTPWGRDPIAELAEACHRRDIQLYFYYSLLDWHHPDYRLDWPAYVRYYQGQVREICTKYGELGGVIFDGYWPRYELPPEAAYFRAGGKWDLADTYDLIHSLQPKAMVANNHHVLPLKGEDWQVWELDMPGENTIGFNTTEIGPLPRATWFNLNRGWSYYVGEQQVKASDQVIKQLSESTKRHATYWLNVGPTPAGEILPEEATVLRQVQAWLREH